MVDASNQGTTSQDISRAANVDSHDVEDIDRELEAYLEEKRSGKSMNFDHSVDEQLSNIRQKMKSGGRENKSSSVGGGVPQKADSKNSSNNSSAHSADVKSSDSEHENIIRSLEEKYSVGKEKAKDNKAPDQPKEREDSNGEDKKDTKDTKATKETEENAKKDQAGGDSPDISLGRLMDNIEGLDEPHAKTLYEKIKQLPERSQGKIIDDFLPKLRRNKERKELFERTQSELENELKNFLDNNASPNTSTDDESLAKPLTFSKDTPNEEATVSEKSKGFDVLDRQKNTTENVHRFSENQDSGQKEKASEEETVSSSTSVDEKDSKEEGEADEKIKENQDTLSEARDTKTKETNEVEEASQANEIDEKKSEVFEAAQEEKVKKEPREEERPEGQESPDKVSLKDESKDKEETPGEKAEGFEKAAKEESQDTEDNIIEEYKQYLAGLDKKPVVLVYEPENGFVRKEVNPEDSSLNLSYSYDKESDSVVLSIFDTEGNELGSQRTPRSKIKS
ncbi:MAG: hypothetical protein U5L75_03765 [Candidatus Campbellbacteria bacterium]|nr:hypothetical protein [Candidatus Campbellbacteria bacterium]